MPAVLLLADAVPDHCPRVLLNRERVGEGMGNGLMASLLGFGGGGFIFEGSEGAYRDVLYLGDTDDGVQQLAEMLGWGKDLEVLIEAGGISGPAGKSESQASVSSGGSGSSSSSSTADDTGVKSKQDSSQPSAPAVADKQGSSSEAGKADKGSADAAAGEGDSKASAGKNSSTAATTAASDAACENSNDAKGAVPQSKV